MASEASQHIGSSLWLQEELDALDQLIATYMAAHDGEVRDPYRGLFLSEREVSGLVGARLRSSIRHSSQHVEAVSQLLARYEPIHGCEPSTWLMQFFAETGLSPLEIAVVLICLAPEVDPRYDRIYGYLNDDLSRKYVTVELALNLLCPTFGSRVAGIRSFKDDAPLVCTGIVSVLSLDASRLSLQSKALALAPAVILGLLGSEGTPTKSLFRETGRLSGETPSPHVDGYDFLSKRVTTQVDWCDLIVPDDTRVMLQEFCSQIVNMPFITDNWGFGGESRRGLGRAAMFCGPPGTGKTMAASVIAHELQRPLCRVDLSQLVSKYIGETEKNLSVLFGHLAEEDCCLLFDEADAVFATRSRVKGSLDRYANLATAHLLQLIEDFAGVIILSTNLKQNVDEAFYRRLAFVIEFQMPSAPERLEIWRRVFPANAPLDAGVDFSFLADNFNLAGASIRNIAASSANLAASDGSSIGMCHLVHATRRELQKLGRTCVEDDFGRYASLLALAGRSSRAKGGRHIASAVGGFE